MEKWLLKQVWIEFIEIKDGIHNVQNTLSSGEFVVHSPAGSFVAQKNWEKQNLNFVNIKFDHAGTEIRCGNFS